MKMRDCIISVVQQLRAVFMEQSEFQQAPIQEQDKASPFSLPIWYFLWEQEVLSELFILLAPPGDLLGLLHAFPTALNLSKPCCACQEKTQCSGPLPQAPL